MSAAQLPQIEDILGLANAPNAPDCIKWSEDGVLAVAAAHSTVLVAPGALGGPRAFASSGNLADPRILQSPGAPADPGGDVHHELAHLRTAAMVSQYPSLQAGLTVRSLGWSPAGCADTAGCLLAAISNDHQVLVYGPPAGPKSEWQQVADLSGLLLAHLDQSSWRDLAPPANQAGAAAAAAAAEGDCLRLRGGGSVKRKRASAAAQQQQQQQQQAGPVFRPEAAFKPSVGQDVEVMAAEEGLWGCWFTGSIQRLASGWALVAYDALTETAEEGSPPLREWFPVPGQRQQGDAPLAGAPDGGSDGGGGHPVHSPLGAHQLRPKPPAQGVGELQAVGATCDCFINDGWWEACRVLEARGGDARLLVEAVGERSEVQLGNSRTTLRFADGQWQTAPAREPVAAAAAASEEAAAQEASAAKKRGSKKKQAGAAGEEGRQQDGGAAAAAVAAAGGAEAEAADAEAPPQKKRRGGGRKQQNPAAAHAGDGALPGADTDADVPAEAAAAAAGAGGSSAGKGKKAAGGSTAKKAPQKVPPTYEVPADFDPSLLTPVDLSSVKATKSSLPLTFCRRFLSLRRLVPSAELPEYEATSSHLKGVDAELIAQTVAELMHVHGDTLAALGPQLNAKWLNTEGRQRLRLVWDRTRNQLLGGFKVAEGDASEPDEAEEETPGGFSGSRGGEEEEEAEGEDELGSGGRGGRRRRASAASAAATPGQALDFPPHELPEGFSWRSLPGVDPSNEATAKKTMLVAAVRRFLTLRGEYSELPVYEKASSHLKGRDAWLVERVTREFATAYAQLIDDLKWTTKEFQQYWGARLRAVWDRVENQPKSNFQMQLDPDTEAAAKEGAEAALLAAAADPAAAEALAARGPRVQHRGSAKMKKTLSRKSISFAALTEHTEAAGEGDTEPSGGLAATASAQKRKKKELAAATAAARIRRVSSGPPLSSAAYQHRLLGLSCLSCAWSPAVPTPPRQQQAAAGAAGSGVTDAEAAERCCFLAVGAKAGRVWLWRYRLPRCYQLDEPQGDASERFELLGCLNGSPGAWVTSLDWQLLPGGSEGCGSLVLVAGYSDGSVLLHGADAHQLSGLPPSQEPPHTPPPGQQQQQQAAVAPRPPAMQRWCVACQPDCRGVTTLSVQLCPSSSGSGSHLLVAAGKAVGTLAVWRSGELGSSSSRSDAEVAKALSSGAASLAAVGIQGTRAVTGLAWLPHRQQQACESLLLACTNDGTVACWRLDGSIAAAGGLALVPADGAPQPCRRRKRREQGHCALGLAVSPSGLFAAVVRLSLSPTAEIMKALQTHERVVQGLVQLDRLAGPGAPLEPEAALAAALAHHTAGGGPGEQQLVQRCLAAGSAWEIAALLRLHAKWHAAAQSEVAAAEAEGGTANGGPAAAAPPPPGDEALVPPLAGAVLQQLEQPVLEVRAAAELGGEDVLPQVPAAAWRSLQLATALRNLLDPVHLVREQRQRVKKQLRKVGFLRDQAPLVGADQPAIKTEEDLEEPAAPAAAAAVAVAASVAATAAAAGVADGDVVEMVEEPAPAPQQQQQQQQQPPAIAPELVAQHGAFASLFAAPPAPQPAARLPAVPELPRPQPPAAPPLQSILQPQQQHVELQREPEPESPLLQAWRLTTERNEMLLLQRQLAATLARQLPGDAMDADGGDGAAAAEGNGGASERRLSQLLMADWVTLNVRDAHLLPDMLPLAASVYLQAGEQLPDATDMPQREASTLFDGPVALAGSGVAAATAASCAGAGDATVPRCPASLLLCEGRPQWACRACGRKYRRPQGTGTASAFQAGAEAAAAPLLPACIFCGLPLGPAAPPVLFSPPCTS